MIGIICRFLAMIFLVNYTFGLLTAEWGKSFSGVRKDDDDHCASSRTWNRGQESVLEVVIYGIVAEGIQLKGQPGGALTKAVLKNS